MKMSKLLLASVFVITAITAAQSGYAYEKQEVENCITGKSVPAEDNYNLVKGYRLQIINRCGKKIIVHSCITKKYSPYSYCGDKGKGKDFEFGKKNRYFNTVNIVDPHETIHTDLFYVAKGSEPASIAGMHEWGACFFTSKFIDTGSKKHICRAEPTSPTTASVTSVPSLPSKAMACITSRLESAGKYKDIEFMRGHFTNKCGKKINVTYCYNKELSDNKLRGCVLNRVGDDFYDSLLILHPYGKGYGHEFGVPLGTTVKRSDVAYGACFDPEFPVSTESDSTYICK